LNQPPFVRYDLSAPTLDGPDFIKQLQVQRHEKYPKPPEFYRDLLSGDLKRETLELWVKNLYYYWGYGVTFSTGAIVCKTNESATRKMMIRKSVRIEGKDVVSDINPAWADPSYEAMWLRFGEGLGLASDAITSFPMYTRSYFAVSTLCLFSRWWEWSWLDGIANFYAADLLGRDYMFLVHDALKRDYGISEEYLRFFEVLNEDVTESIPWEEEVLAEWACTTERQLTAARAFRNRLDIEYQLLLPLHHVATGERVPLQVP
jgi:pyrroloquinoline quinone (PQQ) biosynthesis protein C